MVALCVKIQNVFQDCPVSIGLLMTVCCDASTMTTSGHSCSCLDGCLDTKLHIEFHADRTLKNVQRNFLRVDALKFFMCAPCLVACILCVSVCGWVKDILCEQSVSRIRVW